MHSFPKTPGVPGLADISARDAEEPVEKTAAVQGSSIDTIEQTEGDSEMKTVSVGSEEAAAVLSRHVDGMSLLFRALMIDLKSHSST